MFNGLYGYAWERGRPFRLVPCSIKAWLNMLYEPLQPLS